MSADRTGNRRPPCRDGGPRPPVVENEEDLTVPEPSCAVCNRLATTAVDRVIARHEHWVVLSTDTPGWLLVAVAEHRESTWSLTTEEAAGLGPVLAAASRVLRKVNGAARVYVLALGENSIHCHFLLVPRQEQDSERLIAEGTHQAMRAVSRQIASAGDAEATARRLRDAYAAEASPGGVPAS